MKHLLIILLMSFVAFASNAEDCYFPVSIALNKTEDEPYLGIVETRLQQAFNAENLTAAEGAMFDVVITPIEISKETISGLRATATIVIDIELCIYNVVTEERFGTTSIRVQGSGRDIDSAKKSAANNIKFQNKNILAFVRDARANIINYYDNNLDIVLNQVRQAMELRQLDKCMWLLSSIPSCIKRYGEVISASSVVFDKYLSIDCEEKLAKARSAWAAYQNRDGAVLAVSYLAGIDAGSSCNIEAKALLQEISDRISSLNDREQCKDDELLEFNKELRRDNIDNEKSIIDAIRAIGIEYARNNKQENTI